MQVIQWIIAAATAIFVVVIAFLQWRTAQQKAVLDLFERRHGIYEIVRQAVGTMSRNSNDFDQKCEINFMQAMESAYFFFGDDVVVYLDELWSAIGKVRDADRLMKEHSTLAALGNTSEQRRDAMTKINKFYNEGMSLFARYMRFSQTVPTSIRVLDRLRQRG